jgi:hypothetical protein
LWPGTNKLKPAGETTVVFRDSAFADDVAKTNLAAILQQHGLETVRSLYSKRHESNTDLLNGSGGKF